VVRPRLHACDRHRLRPPERLPGRVAQHPSLVNTIGTGFLFRGLELVLISGTGVPLTADQYPEMHALLRESYVGVPVQTLCMVAILLSEWLLLNRTRFGTHVFLTDNLISARLMGVNVAKVKIKAFVLVGVTAVFCGFLSSIYGYYFWPGTGKGSLLNTQLAFGLVIRDLGRAADPDRPAPPPPVADRTICATFAGTRQCDGQRVFSGIGTPRRRTRSRTEVTGLQVRLAVRGK
jgi:hypothetical protein